MVVVAVLAARAARAGRNDQGHPPDETRSAASLGSRSPVTIRPAVFDRDVPAFDITGVTRKPWRNAPRGRAKGSARCAVEKADHRDCGSAPRRERPRRRRAAEQRDELAASHARWLALSMDPSNLPTPPNRLPQAQAVAEDARRSLGRA